VKNSRVIEVHNTYHYVFIVDEALVVRETRKFLLEEWRCWCGYDSLVLVRACPPRRVATVADFQKLLASPAPKQGFTKIPDLVNTEAFRK
jgi:hypothetical protein